ncbi:MAG: 16S rRNA (guanine(527)-N(7))-methyltransferase RsmG [Paracoccaceae bacterium]
MTGAGVVSGLSDVSRETMERLQVFDRLLRKWNRTINLVSAATVDAAWSRHFLDSAQIFDIAAKTSGTWLDMGSGAGFPGVIVAILAEELAPDLNVTMIESDQRKAAFLSAVLRETGTRATVIAGRIEAAEPQGADVVSARALAPLDRLLGYASRHLTSGGTAIFPKGANHAEEIRRALEFWRFSYEKWQSRTDPASVILTIGGIARV